MSEGSSRPAGSGRLERERAPGRPTLNVDLGEIPGEPEELYALAHIANVACGGHAGDGASMARALALCAHHRTAVGAHPSYPDREGFGRRPMAISAQALEDAVASQCEALAVAAREAGLTIRFVKPHGALYHTADREPTIAAALVGGVARGLGSRLTRPGALGSDLTILGPAAGALAEAAAYRGLAYAREGFADRGTRPDGSLVPRGEPGALLTEPKDAAARARELVQRGQVETLCVHGDTPGAVSLARAVRGVLDAWPRS